MKMSVQMMPNPFKKRTDKIPRPDAHALTAMKDALKRKKDAALKAGLIKAAMPIQQVKKKRNSAALYASPWPSHSSRCACSQCASTAYNYATTQFTNCNFVATSPAPQTAAVTITNGVVSIGNGTVVSQQLYAVMQNGAWVNSSWNDVDIDHEEIIGVRESDRKLRLRDGKEYFIELPDGTKIHFAKDGKFSIDDKDAKVIYRANRNREFNPYVNSSDLLAAFIRYTGTLGVKQGEVAKLPIALFVQWLIVEAAKRDNDPLPDGVVEVPKHPLLKSRVKPTCLDCHRFIPRRFAAKGFQFCGPQHAERYHQKLLSA